MSAAIVDTSVLSGFARIHRLNLLARVLSPYDVVTTVEVFDEIRQGISLYPALEQLLGISWIREVSLTEPAELDLFARYFTRLDLGEATVLAYAKRHGVVALLDEKAGRTLAREEHIAHHGSLWVVAGGIRGGTLSMDQSSEVVDALRSEGCYLPCTGAEFPAWAHQHGLLGVFSADADGSRRAMRELPNGMRPGGARTDEDL